jgi:flagellar L-ring protein precursor FlgH
MKFLLLLRITLSACTVGLGSLSADSLWTAPGSSERGMVEDVRAGRVGDILTIIISEAASQTASQNKQSGSTSAVDGAVTQFLFPASVSRFGTYEGELPAVKLGGSSSFQGGGQVSNTQSINARASVLVTDVLPNGNLVIAGERRLTFSGETQLVILHGLVRAQDISRTNTLLSSNIAEAHLEFISEGSLTAAQKRGWLSRLYEKLRPF